MLIALLLHLVVATALVGTIVALPMGQVLGFIPWIVVVAIACRSESGIRRAMAFTTYVVVTVLIVVAAILAPVKTVDRVLDRPLSLPKTVVTLSEMDLHTNYVTAQWIPRYIHVETTSKNAGTAITFRSTEITLREFIQTIEKQSALRHRFAHCGNGSSILYGGDCSFGVFIAE